MLKNNSSEDRFFSNFNNNKIMELFNQIKADVLYNDKNQEGIKLQLGDLKITDFNDLIEMLDRSHVIPKLKCSIVINLIVGEDNLLKLPSNKITNYVVTLDPSSTSKFIKNLQGASIRGRISVVNQEKTLNNDEIMSLFKDMFSR